MLKINDADCACSYSLSLGIFRNAISDVPQRPHDDDLSAGWCSIRFLSHEIFKLTCSCQLISSPSYPRFNCHDLPSFVLLVFLVSPRRNPVDQSGWLPYGRQIMDQESLISGRYAFITRISHSKQSNNSPGSSKSLSTSPRRTLGCISLRLETRISRREHDAVRPHAGECTPLRTAFRMDRK